MNDCYLFGDKPKQRASIKLTDISRSSMKRQIEEICDRHTRFIEFPFEQDQDSLVQLVHSTVPPDLINAIDRIARNKVYGSILKRTKSTYVNCEGVRMVLCFKDYVCVPCNEYYGDKNLHTVSELNRHYSKLAAWAHDMAHIKYRAQQTLLLARHVINECNTTGQLARAWPELKRYMPNRIREALEGKQRASQLPDGLDMVMVNRERPLADQLLATLYLLPEKPAFDVRVTVEHYDSEVVKPSVGEQS